MRTVFHSLAAALPAIRASATHTANFFIILLIRAARRSGWRAAGARRPGSWPLAAILGDQKCGSEARCAPPPRRPAQRAGRVVSLAGSAQWRDGVSVLGVFPLSHRLALAEKRGILPEAGGCASLTEGDGGGAAH
ncbi:hypothetical protein PUN4_800009 [Paraburkholderia unamae]|nr:hypothetical protein PUN4_800009 [Paraburkholderia unamae]